MAGICLATEDPLSETVAEKLILEVKEAFNIEHRFPTSGNQYLKNRLTIFNTIARTTTPVLLFTDLDNTPCPSELIKNWLGKERPSPNLLFRVAVRETEAWLLADRETFSEFTGIPFSKLPEAPEALPDPKSELLRLIRRYCKNRDIKKDVLPEPNVVARVGLGYNATLCRYVREWWSPEAASVSAPSLARARQRIRELAVNLTTS
jgi:hypothetical protein